MGQGVAGVEREQATEWGTGADPMRTFSAMIERCPDTGVIAMLLEDG
jgi:hypothetical protein